MEPSLDKGKFLDSMSLSTPSLSSVSTDVAQGMAQGDTSSLAHFGSSDGREAAPSYRSPPAKPSLLSPFQEREGEARKEEESVDPAALPPDSASP